VFAGRDVYSMQFDNAPFPSVPILALDPRDRRGPGGVRRCVASSIDASLRNRLFWQTQR
jgi:hypothetical protein